MERWHLSLKGIIVDITRQTVGIVRALLLVVLCVAVTSAAALETFRALPAGNQTPAPVFTLPDHRGTPMHSVDLQGKVVVVRFWATW
jgi:cytochrome oxidase Cu insertion factor (SCO1/SenC/PrrC family)